MFALRGRMHLSWGPHLQTCLEACCLRLRLQRQLCAPSDYATALTKSSLCMACALQLHVPCSYMPTLFSQDQATCQLHVITKHDHEKSDAPKPFHYDAIVRAQTAQSWLLMQHRTLQPKLSGVPTNHWHKSGRSSALQF